MCQYVNVPMCQLAALFSISILINWYIDHIGILYHCHIGTLFHLHIIPPLLSISEGKFDISQPEYGL